MSQHNSNVEGDLASGMMVPFINTTRSCSPQKTPTEDCCHSLTEALGSPRFYGDVAAYPTDVCSIVGRPSPTSHRSYMLELNSGSLLFQV